MSTPSLMVSLVHECTPVHYVCMVEMCVCVFMDECMHMQCHAYVDMYVCICSVYVFIVSIYIAHLLNSEGLW